MSMNVPMKMNRMLIISRKPQRLEMLAVIRLDRKEEIPASVMTLPATAEKAFSRPITAVDAPAMAQQRQKVIWIFFLLMIFRTAK